MAWILPSRSRPHNIKRLVDAYLKTGASTPVLLRLDDDDPALDGYKEISYPDGWVVWKAERKTLSGYYNEVYDRTNYDWYGFIADDVIPETDEWDRKLIEIADSDGMAVPAGAHGDINSENGSPHFVLGGDLVRETGFLCLPGLDRIYIDTVWAHIARKKGVFRHVPDVVLKHLHFSNGAPMDKTYLKSNKDKDFALFQSFKTEN